MSNSIKYKFSDNLKLCLNDFITGNDGRKKTLKKSGATRVQGKVESDGSSRITIGIMSGNSLDGVDAVMSQFIDTNEVHDIAHFSKPYSTKLRQDMLDLRTQIINLNSDMDEVVKLPLFQSTLKDYTDLVVSTVEELIKVSGLDRSEIAAIGLSGQSTGEHNPKSVAGGTQPFTTQIFDATTVAKKTKIPVVYDFRSDDIFNGGEGAPFAPIHHKRLSLMLSKKGLFPVCFINGGNTANVTVISNGKTLRKEILGYDCGAFNHYIDALAKAFYNEPYDDNGSYSAVGNVNSLLLYELYTESAITKDGENFYEMLPPKSSGPHLYNMLEKLKTYPLPQQDIMRTVSYFAAYNVFLSFRFLSPEVDFPRYFLMYGGGWHNSLIYRDFISLLHGRGIILPEHEKIVEEIRNRLRGQKFYVGLTDEFGISGQYMEARIFADLAYCYLVNEPCTLPEVTGCRVSTVCGIICNPGDHKNEKGRGYWYSRAAKGWTEKDAERDTEYVKK